MANMRKTALRWLHIQIHGLKAGISVANKLSLQQIFNGTMADALARCSRCVVSPRPVAPGPFLHIILSMMATQLIRAGIIATALSKGVSQSTTGVWLAKPRDSMERAESLYPHFEILRGGQSSAYPYGFSEQQTMAIIRASSPTGTVARAAGKFVWGEKTAALV